MAKANSKQKTFLVAGVAVLVVAGAVAAGTVLNKSFGDKNMDDMTTKSTTKTATASGSLVQTDSSDYKQYAALKGDDYDREFIANMIVHHEGAVDMARLALTNANRQEIKDMANDIISAQTGEITQMQQWQKDWGYPASSGDNMMDHSAMGMMSDMASMTDELKTLKGDAFDKQFVSSMIMHHQGAINMAAPGETNAYHQEVKDLTKAVVTAQTKEVKQMQQWQKDWGF